MLNLQDKKTLITGGNGFIGRNLVLKLKEMGVNDIVAPSSKDCDLREQSAVRQLFDETKPELVFHLAALVGGIWANMTMKGKFFYENIIMSTLVFEESRKHNVEKLLAVGSGCIYPKMVKQPIKEEYLWDGYPEETNAPYAFAKRMLIVQAQAYKEQYDFNSIVVMPGNLYGPYDNFHLEDSHVVPALIVKFVDAVKNNKDQVVVWGDGLATRDFFYVEDAVDGVISLMQQYDEPEPINLSTGEEVSIKTIVELISELTNFKGEIVWDITKPSGQPRRWFDVTKAKEKIAFEPKVTLEQGLRKTIDWYMENTDIVRMEKK